MSKVIIIKLQIYMNKDWKENLNLKKYKKLRIQKNNFII